MPASLVISILFVDEAFDSATVTVVIVSVEVDVWNVKESAKVAAEPGAITTLDGSTPVVMEVVVAIISG